MGRSTARGHHKLLARSLARSPFVVWSWFVGCSVEPNTCGSSDPHDGRSLVESRHRRRLWGVVCGRLFPSRPPTASPSLSFSERPRGSRGERPGRPGPGDPSALPRPAREHASAPSSRRRRGARGRPPVPRRSASLPSSFILPQHWLRLDCISAARHFRDTRDVHSLHNPSSGRHNPIESLVSVGHGVRRLTSCRLRSFYVAHVVSHHLVLATRSYLIESLKEPRFGIAPVDIAFRELGLDCLCMAVLH